jgi:hypothetical protein
MLSVKVPADAKVFVNDRPTMSTGEQREFVSRNLQALEAHTSLAENGHRIPDANLRGLDRARQVGHEHGVDRVAPPPSAEQPKPGMSSTEITKALGELADLRDRGAISAEDYEAKKSDLLGRI